MFQPTLPLRGATSRQETPHAVSQFQPTLPLRGATVRLVGRPSVTTCFNPRSPCGERRGFTQGVRDELEFQPTLPLRGATCRLSLYDCRHLFQPTLPLRGATISASWEALRAGFQPTLPLRGATVVAHRHYCSSLVSTHAPLAGSDRCGTCGRARSSRFNPRSPCGERQSTRIVSGLSSSFQPTLPLRGATRKGDSPKASSGFQPTLPLRGATTARTLCNGYLISFNPRSPCGERPLHLVNVALRAYHMHDVFHPNASSDELRPSETNQKAVRTSQGIPDSPQFAPPIIPTAYS